MIETTLSGAPDLQEVGLQLDRILAGRAFRRADRLKRLLRYIVDETLAGRAEELKEFSIGVEAFDRDPSFDPRFDAIVRVEARRLRSKLDRYYIEEAEPDEMIVEVPKGGYAVVFGRARTKIAQAGKSTEPVTVSRNTVLTVPFSDYSAHGEEELFCAGLHEEILCALNQIEGLRLVVPSSMDVRDDVHLCEAACRLNASILIHGSVRRSAASLRITIKLIDTASGCYLWSRSIDHNGRELFTVQEEVARMITDEVAQRVLERSAGNDNRTAVTTPEAYNFYLLGRYHMSQRTEEGLLHSAEFFEKAVSECGQYAEAHAGLADAYSLLGHYGILSPSEVWTKTASNAAWAVLCDENSAVAHTSLAHIKATQDWDWIGAEAEFKKAISMDFRYAAAHHWYGISLLAPLGRLEEAHREILLAHSLDPTSPIIARDIAKMHYYRGDCDAALAQCERAIDLNPHLAPAYTLLGFVQEGRGELDKSFAAFRRASQLSPDDPCIQACLAHAHAITGRAPAALRLLRGLEALALKRYVSPLDLALLHFSLDLIDEGFDWLDKAFQDRCFELTVLNVNPRFTAMKTDPRFIALSAKLGLPSVEPARSME